MLTRLFCNVLVRPGDLEPTSDAFEVVGAFNPGAVATGKGDEVVLLVRVAERPREKRPGFTAIALITLALSMHAGDDELRGKLIPLAKKFSLEVIFL